MLPRAGEGTGLAEFTLYLVRHGESFSNVERRLVGVPPGPGLTERGRAQARVAARLLRAAPDPPTAAVTSPFRRTRETAALVAAACGVPLSISPDLREVGFGQWEGRTAAQLLPDPAYTAWHADPEGAPPPGGERFSEAAARMVDALDRLAHRLPGRAAAAFSHQDPITAVLLTVLGLPYAPSAVVGRVTHASISTLRRAGGRWTLVGIDRTASDAIAEEDVSTA